MDCDLLMLVEQDGFRAVRKAMSRGGQYNGPCPFCGGNDRFRVQPHYGRYGFFACNRCERKGNAVDYLMIKRGMSKGEALAAVGWTPKDGSTPRFALPNYAVDERPQWNEPPTQWQEAARDFYQTCQRTLWRSTQGQAALAYLRQRGLTDKTIQTAMLGYHPHETYGSAKEWGRPVKLPQGIVIPWCIVGKVWRVTIRNEHIREGEGRYTQIAGGSNGLYLADSLLLRRPRTILVEGEFDALSLAQECGDLAAVVAAGTTQGSHTPRWIARLECQECVLLAFDAEESGDTAAQWWLKRLSNGERYRPWWKDVNQMLQDGADLRQWLLSFHASSERMTAREQGQASYENGDQGVDDGIASICSVCEADVEYYSEQGRAFCAVHWHTYNHTQEAEPSQPVEDIHLSKSYLNRFVNRVVSLFPGPCSVSLLPSETTLERWLKEHPPAPRSIFPPLPRKQCPARCLIERQRQIPHTKQYYRRPELVPCKQPPLSNGWCKEHQDIQTLLDLGAQKAYPKVHLSELREIDAGQINWEEYARCVPLERLPKDIARLRKALQL